MRLGEPVLVIALVGLAVFSGHLSRLSEVQSGKGVATGAGVFLAIHPLVILISFIFLLLFF